jgi:hypothetical protein
MSVIEEEIYLPYSLSYSFQKADHRDHTFSVEIDELNASEIITRATTSITTTTTQATSSNTSFIIPSLPSIMDQGTLGSCTANAFYYTIMLQTNNGVPLSRIFLYANCRILDNTPLHLFSFKTPILHEIL